MIAPDVPALSSDDPSALSDLAMWMEKLKHLANVETENPPFPRRHSDATVPAHSAGFFYNLSLPWSVSAGSVTCQRRG